jgi:hypothetical protein
MVTKEHDVASSVKSQTAVGTPFNVAMHDLQRWMRANTEEGPGLSLRDAMYEELARIAVMRVWQGANGESSGTPTEFHELTSHGLLQSLFDTIYKLPAQAGSELSKLRDAVVREAGHLLDRTSAKHDSNAFGAELLWFCDEIDSLARTWLSHQAMAPVLAESVLPVLKKFAKSDSLIHPRGTPPPDKFHEDGIACGPIEGSKQALGYALHADNNLSPQAYTQRFRDSVAKGENIWARDANSGKRIEMFVTSIKLRDRCLTRVREHVEKSASESD